MDTQTSAADDIRTAVEAHAAELRLTMTAQFVPQSQSRNRGEKRPTINWIVTLARGGRSPSMRVEYSQGIGHVPGYRRAHTAHDKRQLETAAESGKYQISPHGFHKKTLAPPHIADLLYSLTLDASVLECSGFEDWARVWIRHRLAPD